MPHGFEAPQASVLVVGPSWVGDMVMADALFQSLAARGASVDILAPPWSLPVIERMDSVRLGLALPVAHGRLGLATRRRLASQLRPERYGSAIVLPRSLKAALVPWLARIPRRIGFRGEFRYSLINDMRSFDPLVLDQTVKRFFALGLAHDEPLPPELPTPRLAADAQLRSALLERFALRDATPLIALMPGAEYGPAKCWPIEHFRALAGELTQAGFCVIVLGSARDSEAGATIGADGDARNLCGQTTLAEVIDVLAACDVAVSNDSGLMHIAAAVGCHVIALYGSTSPGFTPPLTEAATIFYLDIECSPCFARECPLGHFRCMREISPADVLATAKALLD